jgi:hypothetical protein
VKEKVRYKFCGQPATHGAACDRHRCQVENCLLPRKTHGLNYCDAHSCRRCFRRAHVVSDGTIFLCEDCAEEEASR